MKTKVLAPLIPVRSQARNERGWPHNHHYLICGSQARRKFHKFAASCSTDFPLSWLTPEFFPEIDMIVIFKETRYQFFQFIEVCESHAFVSVGRLDGEMRIEQFMSIFYLLKAVTLAPLIC